LKPHGVSLFDARPFFEKALLYGVQHGILDAARLESIRNDAPKGMVQIARYFGTEYLRPELEKARERMVNLVSLYLEDSSGGDLRKAAESLRDHSFLSRSKGGSDMLKALIAMPQNSHFGMHESTEFTDEKIPLLAKWSLRTLPEYQAEWALRSQIALLVDAAIWFAEALGQDVSDLEEAGKDAEAVIRTGLLALATRRKDMPDWVAFEKTVVTLRKNHGTKPLAIALPKDLPEAYQAIVEGVRQSVITDLPKIMDPKLTPRKLFNQTPAFMGRYFWLDDALSEVDHFERTTSATWDKATGGHDDEGSLLTLFLCVATGSTPKTLLTEKAATTLVRKIRKSGLQAPLTEHFIKSHAPQDRQSDYLKLWDSFVADALPTLQSDFDYALRDAMALLRRECNIST
jgi:hypothetical protein